MYFTFLKQRSNWIWPGIGYQGGHSIGPDDDPGGIGLGKISFAEISLGKNSVADDHVRQSDPRASFDQQDPGFSSRIEGPGRIRRKVDPLKYKMRACDEGSSDRGEASRTGLSLNWPGIGNGDGAVFVQLALPAKIEQTESRIAVLLNLGEHDTGAYGVDRARGDEDDVPLLD